MKLEHSFFISVLSDHICRRSTVAPSQPLDWNLLVQLAQMHQVDGILFFQCKSFIPREIRGILEERYGTTLFLSANRDKMISGIKHILYEENIEFFIIKGAAVASYYPFPVLRTMGDTDLVVHTEDRQRVHEIFLSLGYSNESHHIDREWIYWKNQMEFELHDSLIYKETINRKSHEAFFSGFWDYVKNGNLDWNFHFLFLLLHLRKHLMNCGVGFRQFMDVAVVTMNNTNLNWTWIEDKLIQLDMIDFARTVFSLNRTWFNVNLPIQGKKLDNAFFETATEQVLNNGVFGFHNAENVHNTVVNIVRENNNAKSAMLHNAISRIFPSYNSMITVPQYRFLIGRNWLLPIAWAYRLFYGVKNNRLRNGIHQVNSSFISEDVIESRSEWLEQWGL